MYKILQVCPPVVIVVAILLSYSNNILKESNYHKSIYILKKKNKHSHMFVIVITCLTPETLKMLSFIL